MQDNFDLKGYLRHGNKLLNEGIGGYIDLKPMNELTDFGNMEEDQEGDSEWMEEIEGKTINDWICFYQENVGSIGMKSDRFPGIELYATPGFEGADGILIEAWNEEGDNIDLNPDQEDTNQYVAGKPSYPNFESYAKDMKSILPTVESMLNGGEESMNEGEPEGDQYDGQYDAHSGPAITSEGFNFEDFMDTDLDGSAVEGAIDSIISEFDGIIKSKVPQELQQSARIEVKKLWLRKLNKWKS